MKRLLPVLLILLATLPETASAKPFYKNGYWWLGRAASGAVILADALSTRQALRACPGCTDQFALFTVKSDASVAGAGIVGFALSTGFSIAEYHVAQKGDRALRIAGYFTQPAIDGAAHGWGIAHNYSLIAQCHQAALGSC